MLNIMDKQEMQEQVLPSPVLPRLDRLDRLLQLLEEKHPAVQKVKHEDDECKTLSSALEEVQHKGTLVERLAVLENRVLQLSLEMDEGNTSKSSSSTVPGSEKLDHGFTSSTGSGRQDKNHEANITLQETQSPAAFRDQCSSLACDAEKAGRKNGPRQSKKGYKRLLGWFHLGCN